MACCAFEQAADLRGEGIECDSRAFEIQIGLAAGLTEPTAGLGAVGGYAALRDYTSLGGQLTVFALPSN